MIKQRKKITAIFIFFLIVFSLTNSLISSKVEAEEIETTEQTESPRIGLIGSFIKFIAKQIALYLVPIFRLVVVSAVSDPPAIEIGYNETVNVDLGMWDVDTGTGFLVWNQTYSIFNQRFLNFQVIEYPGGTGAGSWFITFNPYTVSVEIGTALKTNVSISLTKPPSHTNPVQSGILKIRVMDTWALGNLYFPPKGSPMDIPILKWGWFFSATVTMGYGKSSGTLDVQYKDVNILVKVKPYHAVDFDTSRLIKLRQDQITSIPIRLQNQGNYNDTFGFRIKSKNNNIQLATPFYITLAPGEAKQTYLGISAPQSAFDYGTFHEIIIETYSIDDPDVTIAEKQVFLETRGVYVSELQGIGLIFLTIIILLAVAFFMHRRRIYIEKYCIKPDKPWEIPGEKKYLDQLKKSNKEKHDEVFQMMQEEYESSLLWYKDYCREIIKPKPVKKKKIKPKPKKIKKEKIIKTKEEKPIKVKFTKPIIKEKKVIKIDKKIEAEKIRKNKTLSKIKKEQEKQKRKLKG